MDKVVYFISQLYPFTVPSQISPIILLDNVSTGEISLTWDCLLIKDISNEVVTVFIYVSILTLLICLIGGTSPRNRLIELKNEKTTKEVRPPHQQTLTGEAYHRAYGSRTRRFVKSSGIKPYLALIDCRVPVRKCNPAFSIVKRNL